ncbi:hypothetical protein MKW92_003648, partial [Papaver armeniacum]
MKDTVADFSSNISTKIEEQEDYFNLGDFFDIFAEKDEVVCTQFQNCSSYNIDDFYEIFDEDFQETDVPVRKPQNKS